MLLPLVVCGCPGEGPGDEDWHSLVETEREFAAASRDHGMKVAFLRYLDDESILFRPHPVDGKRHTAAGPESGVQLTWEPTRARVAVAGDLGWTTGPFRVEPEAAEEPALLGYFVSVWKRQPNGRWKVIVDLGTVNPPDDACPDTEQLAPPERGMPAAEAPAGTAEDAALLAWESTLSARSVGDGTFAAYAEALAPEGRLYRDGACPVSGADGVRELLAARAGVMRWVPTEARVADSADLAYTRGSYEIVEDAAEGTPVESGYYVRTWRRDSDGTWKITLDVTSPAPPRQPTDG